MPVSVTFPAKPHNILSLLPVATIILIISAARPGNTPASGLACKHAAGRADCWHASRQQ